MARLLRLLIPLLLVLAPGSALARGAVQYYMVMFSAETSPSTARSSHTFATFVAARDGRIIQEQTISWLPAPGHFGPDYTMPPLRIVPGRNYTLDQTIAMSPGRKARFWGPYEITPNLYDRASRRIAYLNSGATSYKMMILLRDRLRDAPLENRPGGAINCIMAVSDIGGYLDTGTAWGADASSHVLSFLSPQVYEDVGRSPAPNPHIAAAMNLYRRIGR